MFISIRQLKLFISTFVSALLFTAGLGTMFLTFVPALAEIMSPPKQARLLLPLSADREEPFLDIDSIAAKQLFPELLSTDVPAHGDVIMIPSIGVDVPLVMSPSLKDSDIISTLVGGVALYPNGILPGHLGNVFISGHSTGEPWRGKYRFAFIKINDIKIGDIITLDYSGTRYTYKVSEKKLVKPSADNMIVSDRPVPTVTIMACWPLWTTNQRMLITGNLTNITKLTTRL